MRYVLLGRERLRSASSSTTVRVRDAGLVVADGPFAETRKQIALTACSVFLVAAATIAARATSTRGTAAPAELASPGGAVRLSEIAR